MARWIRRAGQGTAEVVVTLQDECPICDHPFGHLKHACIGSTGTAAPLPVRLPETVVA
jgi:hypothetical protein